MFAAGVHERLGVWPEVLTGDEEAALAYDGAVRNLRTPPAYPVLVVDIGGGSTELVLGDASGPVAAQSMDMGSVRMHERYLTSDPPTPDQVAACVAAVDAHLDACPVPVASAATVVGVAGTVLSITAGVLDLPTYDKSVIDQSVVAASDVHAFVERLVAMPVSQRLELRLDASGPRGRAGCGRPDPEPGAAALLDVVPGGVGGRHPGRHRVVDGLTGLPVVPHDRERDLRGLLIGTPEAAASSCSTTFSGSSASSSSRIRTLIHLTFSPGPKVTELPKTLKS